MADILKGPIVANKYKPVPTDRGEDNAPGEWGEIIHDCTVPSLDEIRRRKAAVGSVWTCNNCKDAWILRRNKDYRDDKPTTAVRSHAVGMYPPLDEDQSLQDMVDRQVAQALQWVRKRDLKDES